MIKYDARFLSDAALHPSILRPRALHTLHHFSTPDVQAALHCDGVLPVSDLKKRMKCWGYSKPRRTLTWVTEDVSD